MMYAFAGLIFQSVTRPGNVNIYGFHFAINLWKVQNDTSEILVLMLKCIGLKLFQAKKMLPQN